MAIKKGKWISVSEAVTILGLSDKTIRRRIKSGIMTSKKVGKSYMVYIPDEEVEEEEVKQEEKKTEKTQTKTDNDLVGAIVKQLEEKDKQIKDLNERMRETNILLLEFRRLLPPPKEAEEEEMFEVREVKKEEKKEEEVKKEKKSFNWRPILYILGTLGFSGLVYFFITNLDLII